MKEAVEKDNYRLDRNARRQDNINLFLDYVIDETKAKEIILSLTVMDFSEILQNEHKGFEHEKLYVFGKDVTLLERNGVLALPDWLLPDFIDCPQIALYTVFQKK